MSNKQNPLEYQSFVRPLVKICLGFLVSTFLLTGYFYYAIHVFQSKTDELEKRNFLYVKLIGLQKSFADMENSFRGFVLEEDESFLVPYNDVRKKIKFESELIYKSTMFNYELQKGFRENLEAYNTWISFADKNIMAIKNNDDRIPADHRTKQGEELSSKITNTGNLLLKNLNEQLNYNRGQLAYTQRVGFLGSIILLLTTAFLFFIFLYKGFKSAISSYSNLVYNLEEKKEEADSASKAKDLFLANMSHEIRTPLGSIIGFSEIIEKNESLSVDGISHINFIKKNSKYLLRLINDLFDISKITNNKIEVVNEEIDLKSFISDLKNIFMSRAADKRVELQFRQSNSIPRKITSDSIRLKQIISNLISNAIKFSQKDTTIQVIFSKNLNELVVDVIDQGIGIKLEVQDSIFKPFIQGDSAHSRKYGGAGLGLALSKKLANFIQGDLELISSEKGVGSHFRLTFEAHINSSEQIYETDDFLKEVTNPSVDKRLNLSTIDLSSKNILLAEDVKENQILFKIYIDSSKANLKIVGNGTDAISEALNTENTFDLILMDLQMPGMGGYEAIKALRNSGYSGKVVALTAHALKDEKEKCLRAGFDDYLSKPVSKNKLVSKIHQHVTDQDL